MKDSYGCSEPLVGAFEHGPDDAAPFLALHERFSCTAAARPREAAAVFGDTILTYAELDHASSVFAAELLKRGLLPRGLVPIVLPRSLELLVAVLGVLKAGAAYVPIEATFPHQRIARVLGDCEASIVVCSALVDGVPSGLVPIALSLSNVLKEPAPKLTGPRVEPTWPVYVIYTSGTTGQPKGIVQNHGALSNLIQWQTTRSGIDASGPVLQFSSMSFDVHVQEMFGTWAAGGTVCVIDDAVRRDPDLLVGAIDSHRVRTLFLSVSALRTLLLRDDRAMHLPETVTHIVTAGEQLHLNGPLRQLLVQRPSLTLHNHYGVSESHVVTALSVQGSDLPLTDKVPIGRPLPNTQVRILDEQRRAVGVGQPGEIWISGVCLATGYFRLPALDSISYFVLDGKRAYKTRDLGKWNADGTIEFLGRIDAQVKVAGSLVEPGEVECAIRAYTGVQDCAVVGFNEGDDLFLAAFVVAGAAIDAASLRAHLSRHLPSFMVPRVIVQSSAFPLAGTGKVDRAALSRQAASRIAAARASASPLTTSAASSSLSDSVQLVLRETFAISRLPDDANFFDLGADSLLLIKAAQRLGDYLGRRISPLALFQHPSARRLAAHLLAEGVTTPTTETPEPDCIAPRVGEEPVAVIGMAGRFPGAASVQELWALLLAGRSGLSDIEPGCEERSWLQPGTPEEAGYVRRVGAIANATRFDAGFFGISHSEAAMMDPQHRVFLEECVHALEDGGCVVGDTRYRTGVFAGCDVASYLRHVQPRAGSMTEYLRLLTTNDKDFLATRAAYALDLRGPAVTVQTACSTSLVAIHAAVQAIRAGDCEIALAGASSVAVPQQVGYVADEGGVYSSDGEIRPFDAQARGIVITNGVGVVCLKRLSAAREDGDRIYAVVLGSAINNDGARKAGYAAPSPAGQSEVIESALTRAGVSPRMISCLEAHGTGTAIGDPIEVHALSEVYRRHTQDVGYCALGSLKGNIGHLNRAAGVAGFIKAALSVYHGVFPPTLNFNCANPLIDLHKSPFFVARTAVPIGRSGGGPVIAAVSAFGIGGTNCHAILSEPPAGSRLATTRPGSEGSPLRLLPVSAKSDEALQALCARLSVAEGEAFDAERCDLGFTLARGRAHYSHRRCYTARSRTEWLTHLRSATRPITTCQARNRVAFVFPGQTPISGSDLSAAAEDFPALARHLRDLGRLAEEATGLESGSVVSVLTAVPCQPSSLPLELHHTALVVQQMALTELWRGLGVCAAFVAGYSLGECTAASVAGALSSRDLFRLVHTRARLMADADAHGRLVSVFLPREEIERYLSSDVRPAIFASRRTTILAGSHDAVGDLCEVLNADGVAYRVLANERLNHTVAMRAMEGELREFVDGLEIKPLRIPMASNQHGTLIPSGHSLSADFFSDQVWNPVQFDSCVTALASAGVDAFIEMDAVGAVGRFVKQQLRPSDGAAVISAEPGGSESRAVANTVAEFWERGGAIDWQVLYPNGSGIKTSLPCYPFGGTEYWIPLGPEGTTAVPPIRQTSRLFTTTWERVRLPLTFEPGDFNQQPAARALLAHDISSGPRALALESALRAEGLACCSLELKLDGRFVCPPHLRSFAASHVIVLTDGRTAADDVSTCYLVDAINAIEAHVLSADMTVRYIFSAEAGDEKPDGIALHGLEHLQALALLLPQERPNRLARLICHNRTVAQDPTRLLLAELVHGNEAAWLWYDGESCRRCTHQVLELPVSRSPVTTGAILVVGGLGRVGQLVIPELIKQTASAIVIVGRTSLSDDSAVAARGREILSLLRSDTGASRVVYEAVDASDVQALGRVFARSEQTFGSIAGVLHMAAHINEDRFLCSLKEIEPEEVSAALHPKVAVLDAIDLACVHHRVGFKVLFSSVSVVLGGVGYFSYVLSNLRAASAAKRQAERPRWTVIHWDVWSPPSGPVPRYAAGVRLGSSAAAAHLQAADATVRMLTALSAGIRECSVSRRDLTAVETMRAVSHEAPDAIPADNDADLLSNDVLKRQLRSAWTGVLGTSTFSDDTAFSALGGDSLAAVQVTLRVNRLHGYGIPFQLMLCSRNFGDFCERVRTGVTQTGSDQPKLTDAAPRDVTITPWEERWIQMAARGFGYLDMPIVISPHPNLQSLRSAIESVVRRHTALRTSYPCHDGRHVRLIHEDALVCLNDCTPQAVLEMSSGQIVGTVARAAGRRDFDLSRECPFAIYHAQLDSTRTICWIRTHHVVFDGWSSTVMLDDLKAAYHGENECGPSSVDQPKRLQYCDFASWYSAFRSSPTYKMAQAYWLSEVNGGLPVLDLGQTRSTVAGVDAPELLRARRHHVKIGATLVRALRRRAVERSETIFTLLATCFGLLLHEVSGADQITFGTTSAGRIVPGSEGIVGVFVNPMPIRLDFREFDTVGDLQSQVHRKILSLHQHQLYPLLDLWRDSPALRERDLNNLFNAYLLYQNYPKSTSRCGCHEFDVIDVDDYIEDPELCCLQREDRVLMRDLELIVFDKDDGLSLNFWFREALLSSEAVAGWAARFGELLEYTTGAGRNALVSQVLAGTLMDTRETTPPAPAVNGEGV